MWEMGVLKGKGRWVCAKRGRRREGRGVLKREVRRERCVLTRGEKVVG